MDRLGDLAPLGQPDSAWRISSSRLTMAPLGAPDAADLSAMSNFPEVTSAIPFLSEPFAPEDAAALIDIQASGTDLFLGGRLTGRGCGLVVVVGLHAVGDRDLEMGYWAHPDHQGRGLAREAAAAALDTARRLVPDRRPIAECRPGNQRSWRILLSLGFSPSDVAGPAGRPGRKRLVWTPGQGATPMPVRSLPC